MYKTLLGSTICLVVVLVVLTLILVKLRKEVQHYSSSRKAKFLFLVNLIAIEISIVSVASFGSVLEAKKEQKAIALGFSILAASTIVQALILLGDRTLKGLSLSEMLNVRRICTAEMGLLALKLATEISLTLTLN